MKTKEYPEHSLRVVDVGCGNGYTLSVLKNIFPQHTYWGIEKNDALRQIAAEQLTPLSISVEKGDILEPLCDTFGKYDIVITQRVVINILDKEDQKKAIKNIKELVKTNGILIMMECFESGLNNLNSARNEFDFPPIAPSYHNLYLTEELVNNELSEFKLIEDDLPPYNFLSTHYYVTRVLHDLALQGKPFVRNSSFVTFLSSAIPGNIGDYSPIKLYISKIA